MNYKFCRSSILIGLISILFFAGCRTDYNDYYYVVENLAYTTDSVLLTYSQNGRTEILQKWLKPNESFEIYARKDVSGDGVWNIETSALIYVVSALSATNQDSTQMTEELAQRSFWSAHPEKHDGNGIYRLKITDDLFVLTKQEYHYYIQNSTNDTLFVTKMLLGDVRKRDTIISGQTADLGKAEIFTYDETFQGTEKYDERMLSGLTSLSIRYKGISKNIDLKKYKLLDLKIEQEQCILIIDEDFFD